ncbi:hypothetical protein [Thermostaphylospora chromogena]|nr:hypothetical protein [Thermostaphylospora chromogena]
MPSPLQYGDPPSLGPFVMQARLRAEPAGLVYLARGPDGRAVSVALLTKGAAFDPSARGRFVAAIREAASDRGGARPAGRGPAAVAEEAPPVLAMDTGGAPWVATPYVPGRAGAEWFLRPVTIGGMLLGRRQGPDFRPHWVHDRVPATPAPPRPAPPPTEPRRSVVVAGAVLALLVGLLTLVMWLLVGPQEETERSVRQLPPTVFVPTPPPVPATPIPDEEPSPSPSPGETGPGTPDPDGEDGDRRGEPI